MKMKRLVVVLAAAAAIAASAQTPKLPSPTDVANRQVKRLATLLNLTSAQQTQATTIYTNAAKAEQTNLQAEKEARESLRTAVKSNDAAAIDQAASSIAQSTAQRTATRAKADAAFYQILTADQQTKLSELESQHMGLMEGPGGPGGPPPAMGFR
jgi:Spy/CpxP family protein refolding chaperone